MANKKKTAEKPNGNDEIRAVVTRIRDNLHVTKVVATRCVKGPKGDSFAGFSAMWNTVQEDGGQGLMEAGDEGMVPVGAMSLREAKIASYLLAMQADIAAHEHAMASGSLSVQYCQDAVRGIKNNYGKLIKDVFEV